jgi:hypothetical protein
MPFLRETTTPQGQVVEGNPPDTAPGGLHKHRGTIRQDFENSARVCRSEWGFRQTRHGYGTEIRLQAQGQGERDEANVLSGHWQGQGGHESARSLVELGGHDRCCGAAVLRSYCGASAIRNATWHESHASGAAHHCDTHATWPHASAPPPLTPPSPTPPHAARAPASSACDCTHTASSTAWTACDSASCASEPPYTHAGHPSEPGAFTGGAPESHPHTGGSTYPRTAPRSGAADPGPAAAAAPFAAAAPYAAAPYAAAPYAAAPYAAAPATAPHEWASPCALSDGPTSNGCPAWPAHATPTACTGDPGSGSGRSEWPAVCSPARG